MRAIKDQFDPLGILNFGKTLPVEGVEPAHPSNTASIDGLG